ncbi:hypothetical protein N7501_000171 [Penicillium viridicatum]|nr:hypothetical protein N7501_000171 [Penicillium viridicatum]
MPKAPEFTWPNYFIGGGLVTAEDCSLAGHIHLDGEWIKTAFAQSRLDKRQKFTNVVSVGHNVD